MHQLQRGHSARPIYSASRTYVEGRLPPGRGAGVYKHCAARSARVPGGQHGEGSSSLYSPSKLQLLRIAIFPIWHKYQLVLPLIIWGYVDGEVCGDLARGLSGLSLQKRPPVAPWMIRSIPALGVHDSVLAVRWMA